MGDTNRMDTLAEQLTQMDRRSLIYLLRGMHCQFEMDFTDEFLMSISLERLRHIVLAAALHDHATAASLTG